MGINGILCWHGGFLGYLAHRHSTSGHLCRGGDVHGCHRRGRSPLWSSHVRRQQQLHLDWAACGARAHVLRRAWGVHGRRAAGTVCLCDLCWRQRVHCGRHTEHIDDGEFPGNQRFHGRRFPGTACVCHVRCHWRFLRGRCAGHSGDGRIFLGIDILDFRQRGPPCRSDLRIRLRL